MPINSGREMTWCSHCGKNCETSHDYTTNNASCVDCGKVLFEVIFTDEATSVKDAAGGAHMTGSFVRFGGACFESQRRTSRKGNVATNKLIYKNGITKVSHATRHYKGREAIWCPHCARKGGTAHDRTTGSVHCVDCGKVLFEEIYTEKDTFFRDAARGKDGIKQALDGKRLKFVQTSSEATGELSMKKRLNSKINYDVLNTLFGNEPNPMNCTYAIGKEAVNEDDVETKDVIEEDDYSESEGREWRSYDNEQESCSYDYDYDYDAEDEDDNENDDY